MLLFHTQTRTSCIKYLPDNQERWLKSLFFLRLTSFNSLIKLKEMRLVNQTWPFSLVGEIYWQ